jgi:hypothetical protein
VLLVNAQQLVSITAFAPGLAAMAIPAPALAAGMLVMIDAASFASAVGTIDFSVSQNPAIHMDSAPQAVMTAAPVRSLWQTASIGVRMLLDMNWTMRRTGSVSWMTGVTW